MSIWHNSMAKSVFQQQRWRLLPGSCMSMSMCSRLLIPLRGRTLCGMNGRAGSTAGDLSLVR